MARTPSVDKKLCISCGYCVSVCPEAFRFGSDLRAEVYDPLGAPEKKIQTALDGCPVQCISWRD